MYRLYTARIRPFLTHEESRPAFDGRCSFEITEVEFQTSVGTYLDAPAHRFPGERDVSDLVLDELIHDRNMDRPAHTRLLDAGILIVENLRGLQALYGHDVTFHALPIKVREAVAMPVRAFAAVHPE